MNLIKYLTIIISLIIFSHKSFSQTTMNIYLNDSSVVHIPIELIDSIIFSNSLFKICIKSLYPNKFMYNILYILYIQNFQFFIKNKL